MTCSCARKRLSSDTDATDATAAPPAVASPSIPQPKPPTEPSDQCIACAQKHMDQAWQAYNEHGYELANRRYIRANLRAVVSHTMRDWPEIADEARKLALAIQAAADNQRVDEDFDQLAEKIDLAYLEAYPEVAQRLESLKNEAENEGKGA